ncbi:MAG: hypothetical protein SGILL_002319 [Bacillariaceae sp.]
MAQPEGCYPRLNGGMMQSGKYQHKIISLVGKMASTTKITASDGTLVELDISQLVEMPEKHKFAMQNPNMAIEIVGMVLSPTTLQAFVVRPLSEDMDMALYNQTLQMMQDQKFAQYFGASMAGIGLAQ